jgi:DNA polymerase V
MSLNRGFMILGEKRTRASRLKNNTLLKTVNSENAIKQFWKCVYSKGYRLPLYQERISAGFPSPAEDDMEDKLDLNELLIKHPSATFFLRVSGSSMIKAGIHNNDILVVDRSLEPTHGKIVIASINGELTVKRLRCEGKKIQLVAENDAYPPIDITEDLDFRVWGVVTSVVHYV